MKVLPELKYSKTDEWVKVEGNKATLGISDFAQSQLSDIVYLEIIPAVGDQGTKGKSFATIESVKAASDVNFPVSGKVTSINEKLSGSPETINSDPYGEAWMVKIDLSDLKELDELMDAQAYEKYCQERGH